MKSKNKTIILSFFLIWAIAIVACFMYRGMHTDESKVFSNPRNPIVRYQSRMTILDRYGEKLSYDALQGRKYVLGDAAVHILGGSNAETGPFGYIELEYGARITTSRAARSTFFVDGVKKEYFRTTLDKRLQLAADKALGQYTGTIIVMRLNGEILASVSHPKFDPSTLGAKKYKQMLADKKRPLLNRAFNGMYEPGSVWKLVVALGLLEKGISRRTVLCTGSYMVNGNPIKCMHSHGNVRNMKEALIVSCNVWFMQMAQELSDSDLSSVFKRFMTRTPDFKKMSMHDRAFAAIGQGQVLVSPLEMVQLAVAIGNGGLKPVPKVVAEGLSSMRVMREESATELAAIMKEVVMTGTATGLVQFAKQGWYIAVKTGTSEHSNLNGKTNNALLVGIAGNGKRPEIAFVVIVENTEGTGGSVAVPIVKKVLECYFVNGNNARKRIK